MSLQLPVAASWEWLSDSGWLAVASGKHRELEDAYNRAATQNALTAAARKKLSKDSWRVVCCGCCSGVFSVVVVVVVIIIMTIIIVVVVCFAWLRLLDLAESARAHFDYPRATAHGQRSLCRL